MLVALAALRAGAGRAHVITDATATTAMAVAQPELRVSALPEHARLQADPRLVAGIERADAVVVGSGCTDQERAGSVVEDRKSTRLNSSHSSISYAVFCLKKKRITYAASVRQDNKSQ